MKKKEERDGYMMSSFSVKSVSLMRWSVYLASKLVVLWFSNRISLFL